ncbi:MAG: carbon storage regulator CsrA [Thermodesulfobacteriota bacterium]|nr:carbon storage regulator CsrA [Thermodesulfobacteriota bacterium]
MLVLTRRAEEKIKIGENTVVSILEVDGGTVKIGIDAPKEVTILRMEVVEQIQKQNIESSKRDVATINSAAELLKKRFSGE